MEKSGGGTGWMEAAASINFEYFDERSGCIN